MMTERWKCKNCNHFNEVTAEQRKKSNRDFAILNTSLIIVSGGMWFLIMLIKDLMLFSFETDSITNIAPQGAGQQKKACKVCGAERPV